MASASERQAFRDGFPAGNAGERPGSRRGSRWRGGIGAASSAGAGEMKSDDGTISFSLRPVGERLFIERTHRRHAGTMAVQCLLIEGREEFRRWCELEPTRFDHPVLFDRLRRHGDEILDQEE